MADPLVVRFVLNGKQVTLDGDCNAAVPLAITLRDRLLLTGTKIACGQGNCGACTVHATFPPPKPNQPREVVVLNSCLFPTGSLLVPSSVVDNALLVHITSVEGVVDYTKPTQPGTQLATAIAECNGSQCGFCTPGMVMKSLQCVDGDGNLCKGCTLSDVEDILNGNLCRCTGYRPILYAMKSKMIPTNPQVTKEVTETPACVGRGSDGNYTKSYANGALTSKNVLQPNPLAPKETAALASASEEAPLPVHLATAAPEGRMAATPMAMAMAPALKEHVAESCGSDRFFDQRHRIRFSREEDRPPLRYPATPHYLGGTEKWTDYYPQEAHAPYLGEHDLPERREAFHPTHWHGGQSVAHKDGSWSVPTTYLELVRALNDAKTRSVPARLVAGNVNSSFQPITQLPENTAFISLDKLNAQPIPVPLYGSVPMNGAGVVSGVLALGPLLTITHLIQFLQTDPAFKGKPQAQAIINHLLTVGNIQVRNRSTVIGNVVGARNRAAATDLGLILQTLSAQVLVLSPPNYNEPRAIDVLTYLNQPPVAADYSVVGGIIAPMSAFPTLLSFRRIGTRVENHPTLCSISYYQNSTRMMTSGFTGVPVKTAAGASIPVTAIALGPVQGEAAITKLNAEIQRLYPTLALDGRRLIVNITAAVAISSMPKQTMLEERKVAGSKGSQHFYVQPTASPVTEPIIKPACYDQAAGAAVYTQDVRPPSGNLHITYVQSPCAVVQFNLAAWKAKGDALLQGTGATFVTAKQIADALPTPPNFPQGGSDDLRVIACNVTVNDWKGNLKSDAPQPLQYPSIGGFGEFILAPGFTVYAGQTIAMVSHPELAESRRLAGIVQAYVAQDVLKPTPEVFVNRSTTYAIMNVSQSRAQKVTQRPYNGNQALNLGDVIIARGKQAQYVGADGEAAWNKQWDAWAKDPTLTVVNQFDTTYSTPPPVTAASQTHMYLETQTAMCKVEEGRYIINASTQSSMTTARRVGLALGIQSKDIEVTHNRVGGGFGGKEPQSFPTAIAAAAACKTLAAPVSIQLDRQVDMEMIGKRHAVEGRYRVAIEIATGKIRALELLYDGDAGSSSDCSEPVLELASLSSDNMYWIENYRCTARPWLTHKQTGTAFRSFGVVQAMTITEAAVDHAYFALSSALAAAGKPVPTPDDFRRLNFYTPQNNVTPQRLNPYVSPPVYNLFGQKLIETDFGAGAWKQLTDPQVPQPYGEKSYPDMCKAVDAFNKGNAWRKQGIALMPLRYGISFTYYPMNQGNSTVQIYNVDGSVLVKQGGVEMGQGIQVKCLQNAAAALNAPFSFFRVAPHSTHHTPNAMDTGASTGSDLNVPAVLDAATQLRQRLEKGMNITSFGTVGAWVTAGALPPKVKEAWDPIKTEWNQTHPAWPQITAYAQTRVADPKQGLAAKYLVNGCSWKSNDPASWTGVVANAFNLRIPLVAIGYSIPDGDDGKPLDGVNVFYYYNYAAAWSAVEVDLVTGEVDVLRTDIAYDVGESTNPAVDVGQIEGAFVQGVGNMLTESVTYDPTTGRLNERSIMQYAIPDHRTIPRDFNVYLYWPTGGSALKPLPPDQQGKLPQKPMSRSKTTGEPPLVLSVTVLMAARRAIAAGKMQLFPADPVTFTTLSTPLVPKAVLQAVYGTRTVIDAKGF